MNVVPGLLRHDLAMLGEAPPLLCFDEVDLLRPEVEAHGQILNFLESLPEGLPIIIMGQHLSIDAHAHHQLAGLSLAAIRDLLMQTGIVLSVDHLTRLQDYTQGNPRLLMLFIALHQGGEPLVDVLTSMAGAPSLEGLLNRIWRRLAEPECRLLMDLAVYRRPVASALWPDAQDQFALHRLMEQRLVQSDGQGALMILPIYRQTIYQGLSPENRERLHLDAAAVRASQREYTATAYHYVQAGRPALAVRLWYAQRTAEINQGQAEAALALFGDVSQNQLRGRDQETLGLIRSELWHLQGDYARARESLQATLWQTPLLKARARRLEGDVAEIGGELETAARAYEDGLATLQAFSENEAALFHRDLGWVYRRQHNFDQAWREALLARYEIENLQGNIQRDRGRLVEAKLHYGKALELAQELGHIQGLAKTHNVLANALIYQGEFEAAARHWEDAYGYFKRIGKQSSLASVRANQAVGWVLASQPQRAIPLAGEALAWFERFGQPFGIAVAAQILAEAHLALDELETAERFAWRALETEETSTAPEALRTLGEVCLARQDAQAAEQYIRQALAEAQHNQRPYPEAYAWRALGKVHIAQGIPVEAQTALEQAMTLFQEMGLSIEIAKTQAVLAQIDC
jgi:tetratricopeptide (TPR) repeat protein